MSNNVKAHAWADIVSDDAAVVEHVEHQTAVAKIAALDAADRARLDQRRAERLKGKRHGQQQQR